MSPQAAAFVKANRRSPVVSGTAIGKGGKGAIYELQDGKTFTLTADDCRAIEPRWKLPA